MQTRLLRNASKTPGNSLFSQILFIYIIKSDLAGIYKYNEALQAQLKANEVIFGQDKARTMHRTKG